MQTGYWENLQPLENRDPLAASKSSRLRSLFLALQGALCEARRLGEQLAAEYPVISSNG